jgi:hypothetical protein
MNYWILKNTSLNAIIHRQFSEPIAICSTFKGYEKDEILTAVTMRSSIFWDITPCSPLKVNRRFGGTHRLHLQGRTNRAKKPAWKQVASRSCSAYSSTLKMEAICSSETSVGSRRTAGRYIPEERSLQYVKKFWEETAVKFSQEEDTKAVWIDSFDDRLVSKYFILYICKWLVLFHHGTCGGVASWGTLLKARRSRIRFAIK